MAHQQQAENLREMTCKDVWNSNTWTPNTHLFSESQYQNIPFIELPWHINTRDHNKTILHFSNSSRIEDSGDRITSIGGTATTAAERIIWLALAKDWCAVSFSGDEAFLRAAFSLAMEHGLNIVPKDEGQFHLINQIRTGRRATTANVLVMPAKSGKTIANIPTLGAIGDRLKKSAGKTTAPTKKRRNGI